MDFSTLHIQRVSVRDKIDKDFIEKVVILKNLNGWVKAKPIFAERVDDKMLNFYKVDNSMHLKIDKNLLPKNKKVSYFESIKASETNTGKGPYKLTRYKVYEEPPKPPVMIEESIVESSIANVSQSIEA